MRASDPTYTRSRTLAAGVGCLLLCLLAQVASSEGLAPVPGGELWIQTEYSSVILRDKGRVRLLYFVRDSGEQMVESAMDLALPHRLLIGYTRTMFASYLFVPEPSKVLIVGLGAGSMVRFLEYHDPRVEIVAIDIDPMIVEIADKYFGTRPGKKVRLLAADGIEFLRGKGERFDVIYMDAFLKPSDATDSTGVPLAMKTRDFHRGIQARLTEGGAVVFNINMHEGAAADVEAIRRNFAGVFLFRVRDSGNLVVVATMNDALPSPEQLRAAAQSVDARLPGTFSIRALVAELEVER